MERRLSRETSRDSKSATSLQRRLAENKRPTKLDHVPDLTDFMNDMFFGTLNTQNKAYNLTGTDPSTMDDEQQDFDDSTRSNSSRLTQEWLEEARRMVASSPSRCDSPSRLVGSPRFAAAAAPARLSSSSLDRRDPLSRSARRHRPVEGLSGEILSKSAKHRRNRSESLDQPGSPTDLSPASAVHKWFTNILKPSTPVTPPSSSGDPSSPSDDPTYLILPPRQSTHRSTRFKTDSTASHPKGTPVPNSRRTFRTQQPQLLPLADTQLLSPPKTLVESAHGRSLSSSTCSLPDDTLLSPPRKLVESAHRRSVSKSTCSVEKIAPRIDANGWSKEEDGAGKISLNGFLKEQRVNMEKILNGVIDSKAKIVLSGPSNSTSSMVAAICYAWLLENRKKKNRSEDDGERYLVLPVMNIRRGKMWKQQQAAWLFHHVGLDAASLLFADEVDLESLMMNGQLTILVIGQDVLKTIGEVGSQCTFLTDNYCEDAYDLLQTPLLKKLLLAGILLDTENLNASDRLSMTRDAEAVQLLLVGSSPNYRNALFDQLTQDHWDNSFVKALQNNYGKRPSDTGYDDGGQLEHRFPGRRSASVSHDEIVIRKSDKNSDNVKNGKTKSVSPVPAKHNPAPAQASPAAPAKPAADASRGKNKFFLAKWFGFGSK